MSGAGQRSRVRLVTSPIVQDTAGGIAQVLGIMTDFARGDKMCVLLGEKIGRRHRAVRRKLLRARDVGRASCSRRFPIRSAMAWRRWSVSASLASSRSPEKPVSNYAVTGHLLYDDRVFDIVYAERQAPRRAGNHRRQQRLHRSRRAGLTCLKGYWTDAGTHDRCAWRTSLCWACR